MKVDFKTPICNLKGEAMKNAFGVNDMADALLKYGVPQDKLNPALIALDAFSSTKDKQTENLLAHHLAANALQFIASDEKIDGATRMKWMRLAFRVMDSQQPVEIDNPEKKLILERVEKAYAQSVLLYGRMEELFLDAEIAAKPKADPEVKQP